MRIKIFSDSDIVELEQRVNDWLEENETAEVVQLAQTESPELNGTPWSARITLLYRESRNRLAEEERIESEGISSAEELIGEPMIFERPERLIPLS
jgi:hypothetical protein